MVTWIADCVMIVVQKVGTAGFSWTSAIVAAHKDLLWLAQGGVECAEKME